ncbi:carboxypeptidase-like regulatory domain-containing protein [Fibrella sp. WM1]|uniref:carboxypeptidase-like regulatory domain-containing protein n=1 Tax=Fibrella musci TaxID=3242485 RepID=UPI003522037B
MFDHRKASFCFFWLSIVFGVAHAQNCRYSGQIVSADGTPVPFATITSVDGQHGRYADQNGTFELPFCADSVQVSALGFRSLRAKTRATSMRLTLAPQPIELSEVVVRGKATGRTQSFGFYRSVRIPPIFNFSPNTACTIAAYVANSSGQVGTIQTISCRLAPNRSAILTAYVGRLHIFADSLTQSSEHYPGRDLLLTNTVVMIAPNARAITASPGQLVAFPETGAWVAIELIGYVDPAGRFHQLEDNQFGRLSSGKKRTDSLLSPFFAMKKKAAGSGLIRLSNSRRYTRIRGEQAPMFGLTATF